MEKNLRTSTFKWPRVGKIPKKWIPIWKTALYDIILPKLQSQPLGRWVAPTHQRWHYTTVESKAYVSSEVATYYQSHHLQRSRYKQGLKQQKGTWAADVTVCGDGDLILESYAFIPTTHETIEEETSLLESFENIKDWRRRNWGSMKLDMDCIAKNI